MGENMALSGMVRWSKQYFWTGIVPFLVLCVAVAYSGFMASVWMSNNADAIVSSQISAEPLKRGALHLGNIHSNLFKFPLFAAQGHFHYGYASFVLVNIALLAATVFGWLALLCAMSSWRYFATYAIAWIFLLLGTANFSPELIYTTVRNIEFPLMFLFVYLLYRYIVDGNWKWLAAYTPFFVVLAAGDLYILYVTVPAVLITVGIAWLQTKNSEILQRKRLQTAALWMVGAAVAAKLLLVTLEALEFFKFVPPGEEDTLLLPLRDVLTGSLTSLQTLFNQVGVNIFGQAVKGDSYARAVFLVVTVVLIGIFLRRIPTWFRQVLRVPYRFMYANLAIIVLMTFFLYVISGRWGIPGTGRYLIVIPLALMVVVPLLQESYVRFIGRQKWITAVHRKALVSRRALLVLLCVLGVAFGFLVNDTQQQFGMRQESVIKQREFYSEVHQLADANDAHVAVMGFWQASPVEFWTNNKVKTAAIAHCNKPMPYLSHRYDYKAGNTKTLLVIDRKGMDSGVWQNCPNDVDVEAMYGKPLAQYDRKNQYGEPIEIWVYGFDIRAKLDMRKY